ncbi:MAG: hypothetical protein QOG20_6192, partial [Pseudonocardiales bacterium]|nr:hypothetical protein [Pseudonocardiales bacterium]
MRTVCGMGRRAEILVGRGRSRAIMTSHVRPLAGGRLPL